MQTLIDQFDTMLNSGTMPVMEFELNNGEYLTVDISIDADLGVCFEFDRHDCSTYFSEGIETLGDGIFALPFDPFFTDLDYYLQEISQEITEGFLIPNDVLK